MTDNHTTNTHNFKNPKIMRILRDINITNSKERHPKIALRAVRPATRPAVWGLFFFLPGGSASACECCAWCVTVRVGVRAELGPSEVDDHTHT